MTIFTRSSYTNATLPPVFTMPSSFTSIGDYAFQSAPYLTSITIPASVTSIGDYAFYNAPNLTYVIFEENSQLITIGDAAFYNATSLTSITIPSSVTSIGNFVFDGMISLTSINVDISNSYYASVDGVFFNKNKSILIEYPEGKPDASYTIPNSVTSIEDYVFRDATSLTSITIPASVTSIGRYAFANASDLTSITFEENSQLTSIGNDAFNAARYLTSITIPDSVISIGNDAFSNTGDLTSITIPNSVTSIGTAVFRNATSLTTIYLTEDLTIDATTYTIGTSGTFFGSGNVSFVQAPVILAICFPAGTPVTTDQGNIPIEKLKSHIHTIRGKSIVAITQTRLLNKHIVSIEKDALVKNVPSQTTHISNNHKVFFEGQMVKARDLVDVCEHVHFIPYNGETLYNVLLKKDGKMMINNLICETLSPTNVIAMILKTSDKTEMKKKLRKLTSIINKNDKTGYKKFYASLK